MSKYTKFTCPDREKFHTKLDPGTDMGGHRSGPKINGEPAAKRHVQLMCPTCGLWTVWESKVAWDEKI